MFWGDIFAPKHLNNVLPMKVLTCLNFELTDNFLSANNGEIITVPDQALTPQQIMQRYSTGNLQGVSVNDFYFDVPIDDNQPVLGIQPSINDIRAVSSYVNSIIKSQRYQEQKNQTIKTQSSDNSTE